MGFFSKAELALIDEEQRKLNREMAKFLIEDERRRKKLKDERELERRKHSDNFTPDQVLKLIFAIVENS